ncbi:phosphonate metabolism transcriptional regulator PhnF [Chitinilyticum litopenaei]|uniref:phosphonate metabolism transcriptional regulator PhnF n=1 Tax=Chitinilyticum litopenaei TaxID=1121276 RepID=UPI0004171D9C|nr:phosphonate metabolism transcriptional regulator PhnF [Chitinilyticum litopenaei]
MAVQRGGQQAVWRGIANTLAAEIASKTLQGQLPVEASLAERFAVNRHTVRRALQELENQGLVRIEQGRGTFVQEDLIDYRMGRRERFSHSLAAQRLSGESELLQAGEIPASDDVAALLRIAPGAPVLRIDLLDKVEGQVIGVCTEYLILPRCAGAADALRQTGSMVAALQAMGITGISRQSSRVTARLPRPEVAARLGQPKSQPVLYVESVYQDAAGRVFEYGITRFAGNAIQLTVEPD